MFFTKDEFWIFESTKSLVTINENGDIKLPNVKTITGSLDVLPIWSDPTNTDVGFSSWGEHFYFDLPISGLIDHTGNLGGYSVIEKEKIL